MVQSQMSYDCHVFIVVYFLTVSYVVCVEYAPRIEAHRHCHISDISDNIRQTCVEGGRVLFRSKLGNLGERKVGFRPQPEIKLGFEPSRGTELRWAEREDHDEGRASAKYRPIEGDCERLRGPSRWLGCPRQGTGQRGQGMA